MKKLIAILMATAIVAASFAGCTQKENKENETVNETQTIPGGEKDISSDPVLVKISEKTGLVDADKTVVMTVDGKQVSLAEYEMAYFNTASQTINSLLEYAYYGIKPDFSQLEDEEFIKATEESFYINLKMPIAIEYAAAEKNIALSEEEFNTSVLSIYDEILAQYNGSVDEFLAEPMAPTVNSVVVYQNAVALYDKLCATYTDNEAVLAKANEVLEKAKAGEDFDKLIEEYNEDPGMTTYTDGYFFTYGAMVPEFEETAFALALNEISDIVETDYGYHILQKLPVDDAFKATTAYTEVYDALSAELEGEELEAELANYVRVKHVLVQLTDGQEACFNDLSTKAEEFEVVKVENFDELTASVAKEVEDVVADLIMQVEESFAEPEEVPEVEESEESAETEAEETTEEVVEETAETEAE